MRRTLEVWCFDRLAGELVDDGEALTFAYDRGWSAAGYPPLSQSLPLGGEFGERDVKAFFGGLVPEGELRGTPGPPTNTGSPSREPRTSSPSWWGTAGRLACRGEAGPRRTFSRPRSPACRRPS
ncbi:MAG TPA: HipA N-terminal domain-containing protein [Solirubrobacterales bacterium]|nr:HipA N-terminal domain-containing protein [Solirubrobacterales bacterium]